MREVLERFDFDNTISKLDEAGLLFQVLERFRTVDLHPYNTGIATYVWLLTNRRAPARRGLVQLIDATAFWSPMRRSLGDKRRGIPPDKAADVLKLLADCRDGETRVLARNGKDEERIVSRIFPTTRFGIPKITVERPLRLNFQASAERIAHLEEQKGFQNLAKSKKRGEAGTREEAEGRARQQAILGLLERLPDTLHKDRAAFLAILTTAVRKASVKLRSPVLNAILAALAERDETAAICRDKDGMPEPDPELRDSERVPLVEGEARQIRSDCRCGVAGVKHAPSGFHCCPFARRATDFTVIGRSDGDGCGRAGGVLRPAGVSGGPSCAEGEWRGDGGSPQGRSGGRGPRAGVGGHLEEVEHTARISGQATHGLGDGEPARLDEADGEAA